MRIIISGQAGTRKTELAEKIRNHTLQERKIGPNHPASSKEIQWLEVEDEKWLGVDFLNYINNYNESRQHERWANALQAIKETLDAESPKDCLLLIHTTFYRNGRFFSPVSWDDLLLFRPDCVITLIDDIYDIWQRIEHGPHDTHFSLDEILTWRSVETMNSRTLALNLKLNPKKLDLGGKIPTKFKDCIGLPIPHFVMSVKHPVETFYQLLFERDRRPIIYASFPITRTRGKTARREDIDSFRNDLKEAGAIVIDPLTIDELRLPEEDSLWLALRDDIKFQEYQNTRWELNNPAIEPQGWYSNPFCDLSEKQILQARNGIKQQVVDRDFRLIARSQKVIAYRPFYPEDGDDKFGSPSNSSTDGVTREMHYAADLEKAVWAFHPKCDWRKEQEEKFFSQLAMWSRVRRFPRKTDLKKLDNNDFTGFGDLLKEVSKLVSA